MDFQTLDRTRQLDAIAKGQDPIGVHFDRESACVRLEAGQRIASA